MYLGIKAVKPQKDYLLLLTFENDEKRVLDMKPYLDFGPVFTALRDTSLFNTAYLDFNTVAWANEADLDPEMLYKNSKPIKNLQI